MKPYYEHAGVTIYHGDCREVLPGLDGGMDLVCTSPPYDAVRAYCGFEQGNWLEVIQMLYRPVSNGGIVMWNVSDQTVDGSESGTSFRQALHFLEVGFRLHDTMIYLKEGIQFPDSNRYLPAFEYMFVASKGSPKTFNPISDRRNKYAGDKIHGKDRQQDGSLTPTKGLEVGRLVREMGWRYNYWLMANRGNETGHPATMPYAMARDHILTWTHPLDMVTDPFAGSGTVLDAAKKLQRRAIGIEIDERYCEIAAKRLSQEVLDFQETDEDREYRHQPLCL